MLAYHNDDAVKQFYIDRLTAHYHADEIIKGKYWEHGKGCAVGCLIHDSDHSIFPKKLGIPIWFARVAIDQVFENLPHRLSKDWPLRIMQAIPVGCDLQPLLNPLLIWIVKRAKSYVKVDKLGVINAIDAVIKALETGVGLSDAERAAWAAAWACRETEAERAEMAAWAAWGRRAAEALFDSSRESTAAWVTRATEEAAWEATGSEDSAAARELFWIDLSDEIIRLLGDTHVSIS